MEPPTKRRKAGTAMESNDTIETVLLDINALPTDLWYCVLSWALEEEHVLTLSEEAKVWLSHCIGKTNKQLYMRYTMEDVVDCYQPMPVGFNGSYTCHGMELTYRLGLLHSYNDNPAVVVLDPPDEDDLIDATHENSLRDDGAPVWKMWMTNGKRNRTNGKAAVLYADGGSAWFVDGIPSRSMGLPNYVGYDGTMYWFNRNSELHRDGDLPAEMGFDGYMTWFNNGAMMRGNGEPAHIERGYNIVWKHDRSPIGDCSGRITDCVIYAARIPAWVWCGPNGEEASVRVRLIRNGVDQVPDHYSLHQPEYTDESGLTWRVDIPGLAYDSDRLGIFYTPGDGQPPVYIE